MRTKVFVARTYVFYYPQMILTEIIYFTSIILSLRAYSGMKYKKLVRLLYMNPEQEEIQKSRVSDVTEVLMMMYVH